MIRAVAQAIRAVVQGNRWGRSTRVVESAPDTISPVNGICSERCTGLATHLWAGANHQGIANDLI
jgi:hypothetical protein